jgi:hypothetical protein
MATLTIKAVVLVRMLIILSPSLKPNQHMLLVFLPQQGTLTERIPATRPWILAARTATVKWRRRRMVF